MARDHTSHMVAKGYDESAGVNNRVNRTVNSGVNQTVNV